MKYTKFKLFIRSGALLIGLLLLFGSFRLKMADAKLPTGILFCQTGTNTAELFKPVHSPYRFDVVNPGKSFLMVKFIFTPETKVLPAVVYLSPGERQLVTLNFQAGAKSFQFSYATAFSEKPFTTHSNRYRAYSDGETVMCVPVDTSYYAALQSRTVSILRDSKTEVTDQSMPSKRSIYTPGPFYRKAGIFARDFLYQLEGAGRNTVTAEEVKLAVDYHALKQLKEDRKVGGFTYPKGAIPDHIYPDGRFSWGPGEFYGDNPAHFNRPSMDEAMCFIILGWHYGYKSGWNNTWKEWFGNKAEKFTDAWNSVPRNASTGLVTQWSTPGHIGANNIQETNGACVMWGFHDSYGFGGDDLGTSVLACNAARALADMYEHADKLDSVKRWEGIADNMRDAIRAQFNPEGYLPWGVGQNAPSMASPDVTGYAVWSGILSEKQSDAASDWFARQYAADRTQGGAANLFQMAAPFRGAVRMVRKPDDISPGRHVWPDMKDGNHWENLAYGYNAYQDGGYWYYMSLGVATTLWRKHPDLAREWVGNTYSDLAGADAHVPYERIDGMKPVNDRYNASVGSLMGMGMPAVVSTVKVEIQENQVQTSEIYVALNGNDTNPGTKQAPLATIDAAQNAVRRMIINGLSSNVHIFVRSGTYRLTNKLVFGPEDSGTEKFAITYSAYPGEKVILSGGKSIGRWKKQTGEVWNTFVPEVKSGDWYFRQLYVKGKRAVRARTPNPDDENPWWKIDSSTASKENLPSENDPITLKLSGILQNYSNQTDMELVYMQNNECGWKRVASVDQAAQTLNLATPHRWNPKEFVCDWYLSIPFAGKSCYLENAPEMLDQPGEWYLDRKTGILTYWPRPGEDLTKDEVIAPLVQNTLLEIKGSRDKPVENLHFKGLNVQYVDWPQPAWGYMAMFCCNVAVTDGPKPGHRPIDAAVEFRYARSCSYTDGGIAHAGGMGMCLREGTSDICIEGNDIGDLSGGGIAAGWPNAGAGYLDAAPAPLPGEFLGYRIANNHIHKCGTDYFGAVGILLLPSRQSVVSHNTIDSIAYFGIGVAGSQDPKVPFAGDNLIAYNHIFNTMTTTIDGAAIYVTFGQYGKGTRLLGNVIHDTYGNPYHEKWGVHPPSGGIYLDGNSQGGIYENNILYRNFAAGPLIFNYKDALPKNRWIDNVFEKDNMPPSEFVEAVLNQAGPEPEYSKTLLGTTAERCQYSVLGDTTGNKGWGAYQYHFQQGDKGVLQVVVREGNTNELINLKLNKLKNNSMYELKAYRSFITPQQVWAPDPAPVAGKPEALSPSEFGLPLQVSGNDLSVKGLELKAGKAPQMIWIVYQAKTK